MPRKKRKNRNASLRDILDTVKKPKLYYRCLECGNEGHPREMLMKLTHPICTYMACRHCNAVKG